jgi:hypothetical protein
MAAKVLYSLMSLDLRFLLVLSMPGRKEAKKFMVKDKENGEKEKI